ncbi:MAG: preprotein translocase subunit SecG [Fusobacteriota bacterium]
MTVFLTIALFLLAITLIILVLIQPDRSKGMGSSFGSGASNTVFGVSEDGGPLAKITEIVAALFMVVAIALYIVSS